MIRLFRVLPCLLSAFLLIAAGGAPDGHIIAQRGDVRLTDTDLKNALNLLEPAARAQVTASPQTLSTFVRDRLLNLSVLAEAKGKAWDQRPEVMQRVNEAKDAVILQTYLASVVPPDPSFPTEAEITTAYEANKAHLVLPRQYRLAQIVLAVRPGAPQEEDEAARKKAVDLRAQAMRPKADFADIARKNSQDSQSAEKGGDIGWLREPDMMPSVRDAITPLVENGVSTPVRLPDGWHILKLQETKPAGQIPLLDAKPQIVQALRQARTQKLMRSYLDEELKTQPIEVNEIELTKQVGAAK
jgi:parvulin-like peptidyl-prolyl isomerase